MESDKRYFFEGLFIIVFALAIVFAFAWLAKPGHRDDVMYRIRFNESVSGMSVGDTVKFRGVDMGTVKAMAVDEADPRRVRVDIHLRKDAPVKTDTKASLKLKGITGAVFIELDGGSPNAEFLAAATSTGEVPEIPAEKSKLTTALDQLPAVVQKFSALEDKTARVLNDVGEVTRKVKENPSLLLRRPKEPTSEDKEKEKDKEKQKVTRAPKAP
jgi:phospholipid/cholesterol/gamma-HCH transport system substrate-binding protein